MDQKIGRFSIKTISHTRGQRQRLLSHLHRFSLTYHNFITHIHSFYYNTQNSFCNFDLQTGKTFVGSSFLSRFIFRFSRPDKTVIILLLYNPKVWVQILQAICLKKNGVRGFSYWSSVPKVQQGTPSSRRVRRQI